VVALLARHINPLVGEIADAGRKAKAQQMTERKDMVDEAGGIGVMLFDPQVGFVVKQAVENMRGIAGVCGNHLGVEGRARLYDALLRKSRFIGQVIETLAFSVDESMNQSGRSDCLYGRILSTVHNEVAACDPGGAIRNEESDDLCDILRNALSAQRNRGSHGLRVGAISEETASRTWPKRLTG
jgi:hypothetical protein